MGSKPLHAFATAYPELVRAEAARAEQQRQEAAEQQGTNSTRTTTTSGGGSGGGDFVTFTLQVKTLTNQVHRLDDVSSSWTIARVKQELYDRNMTQSMTVERVRLIRGVRAGRNNAEFPAREMLDDETLHDNQIGWDETGITDPDLVCRVYIIMHLRGS